MTHTLHRKGDLDTLKSDYVLLFVPDITNIQESGEKMKQIWDVFSHHKGDIVNYGNCSTGNSHRFSMEDLREEKAVCLNAVFKDRDKLKACLQEIKDRDFGISVVISGLYEEVAKICKEIGLFPHTVGLSLGIHGKIEKLPDKNILDITTMCGHHMVSHNLVNKMIKEVNNRKKTCKEAATELSRQCPCGAFNPYRAEKLLARMASSSKMR
jgi:hypothetical protein